MFVVMMMFRIFSDNARQAVCLAKLHAIVSRPDLTTDMAAAGLQSAWNIISVKLYVLSCCVRFDDTNY